MYDPPATMSRTGEPLCDEPVKKRGQTMRVATGGSFWFAKGTDPHQQGQCVRNTNNPVSLLEEKAGEMVCTPAWPGGGG